MAGFDKNTDKRFRSKRVTVKLSVVIVGSGIIGASVALACQDLGADVTVVDQGPLGGVASRNSFGWINASFAETQEYFELRHAALVEFRALDQRLGLGDHMRWQGTLWWEDAGMDFMAQFNTLTQRGYLAKLVAQADIAALEPQFRHPPQQAILTTTEGAAQAQSVALAILVEFVRRGGSLRDHTSVTGVKQVAGRIASVHTDAGDLSCDVVVLATGAAAQSTLSGLDWALPMANEQGMILQTAPVSQAINHILMTPDVHFRQNPDGSFVAGEIFSGEIDPNVNTQDLAAEVVTRIQAKLCDVPKLRLAKVKIGTRPVPFDGLPVVGAVPGVKGAYAAVMHSGVTLGPLVGQLLASEILKGVQSSLLSQFRPSRFLSQAYKARSLR